MLVGEVGRQQGRRAPHVGETREIGAEGGGGGELLCDDDVRLLFYYISFIFNENFDLFGILK